MDIRVAFVAADEDSDGLDQPEKAELFLQASFEVVECNLQCRFPFELVACVQYVLAVSQRTRTAVASGQ